MVYKAYYEGTLIAIHKKKKTLNMYMQKCRHLDPDDYYIIESTLTPEEAWAEDEYIIIRHNDFAMTGIELSMAYEEFGYYIDSLLDSKYTLEKLKAINPDSQKYIDKTINDINEFIDDVDNDKTWIDYITNSDIHNCDINTFIWESKSFKEKYL